MYFCCSLLFIQNRVRFNSFLEFFWGKIKSIDYKSVLIWSLFMFALFHTLLLIEMNLFLIGLIQIFLLSIVFPLYLLLKKGHFPHYLNALFLIFIIIILYHLFTYAFYRWIFQQYSFDILYYLIDFFITIPILSFFLFNIFYFFFHLLFKRWAQ